jgi:hypothetical protein
MQKSRVGLLALSLALAGSACGSEDGSKTEDKNNASGDTYPNPCVDGPFAPEVEELPIEVAPPIVFVHGYAGSAQQFQAQAMRFDANGYPHERIFAYDHHGGPEAVADEVLAGIDATIDAARKQFGVDKVILVGHSRGTFMSNSYMQDPARTAKVAKYVSLDGAGCGTAMTVGVDCIAPNQANLPGLKHVEVATSPEAFVEMFKFIVGTEPAVKQVLPVEGASKVTISGRAVDFPANTGKKGAVLKLFPIDPTTGHRTADEPVATATIGADGNFGPFELECGKYYEKELTLPDSDAVQHFYMQPYVRDTNFVRLLSAAADAESVRRSNLGDDHAAVVLMRMREWCDGDELYISTTSESKGDQAEVNAMTAEVAACGGGLVNGSIGIYIHDDAASPGETSLELLPWFPTQPFQSGVDVFMPAADPPDGTITFRSVPRGYTDKEQVLRSPNWASSKHRIMFLFNDYHQ